MTTKEIRSADKQIKQSQEGSSLMPPNLFICTAVYFKHLAFYFITWLHDVVSNPGLVTYS
jgi:hypothetical protein